MAEEDAAPQHNLPACSRLCVKNLPKHVTEKRLRDHFTVKGEVTDVKILKTRQGLTGSQWQGERRLTSSTLSTSLNYSGRGMLQHGVCHAWRDTHCMAP